MRRDILRISAVVLVVLAVSPVTAPFSTYDFAAPAPDTFHEGVLKAKPASDKSLTPTTALARAAVMTPSSPDASGQRPIGTSHSHRPLRFVLRL